MAAVRSARLGSDGTWACHRSPGSVGGASILSRMCWVCDNSDHPVCGAYRIETGFTELFVARDRGVPEPRRCARSHCQHSQRGHQSLGAKARRAAVATARATAEATAKNKGITTGNLQAKIDRLHANGPISEDMKEAAHEVRFVGNEAAHGDILNEPISLEDAKEIVELMDAILERVHQEPAKVARVRANRLARQTSRCPLKPSVLPLMDDYEARLTAKLSHEGMTRTLIRAGTFLSAYELIKLQSARAVSCFASRAAASASAAVFRAWLSSASAQARAMAASRSASAAAIRALASA